jgi:hypothetical protein
VARSIVTSMLLDWWLQMCVGWTLKAGSKATLSASVLCYDPYIPRIRSLQHTATKHHTTPEELTSNMHATCNAQRAA